MSDNYQVAVYEGRFFIRLAPDDVENRDALQSVIAGHQIKNGWNDRLRCYSLPPTVGRDLQAALGAVKYSPEALALIRTQRLDADNSIVKIAGKAGVITYDLTAPLPDGTILYKHQRIGVATLAQTRDLILADDMGLGKTVQSLLAAKILMQAEPDTFLCVVCPANKVKDWRDDVLKYKVGRTGVYSWNSLPAPYGKKTKYILIADEAHYIQNSTTKRTKEFLKLCPDAMARFMLTGTPIANGKPINIFTLLKAIKHPLGEDKKEFERKFCAAHRRTFGRSRVDDSAQWIEFRCPKCGRQNRQRYGFKSKGYQCSDKCGHTEPQPKTIWDNGGASNMEELKRELAPVILRRIKSECLDLPPKTIVVEEVEITAEMQKAYDSTVAQAKSDYATRVREGKVSEAAAALTTLSFVRKAASLVKVEWAVEKAREAMEEGSGVVVMAEFRETAERIAKEFKTLAYTGEGATKEQKRELYEGFQQGRSKIIVGTGQSIGTGLNLQAGNVVILVDRPLRPADADQYADRCYRIGQKWPVTVYWGQAFAVCKEVDALLSGKKDVIQQILGDGGGEEVEAGKGKVAQMVLKNLFK